MRNFEEEGRYLLVAKDGTARQETACLLYQGEWPRWYMNGKKISVGGLQHYLQTYGLELQKETE